MGQNLRPSNKNLEGVVPYDPKYLPARLMLSANENPGSLPPAVAGSAIVALSKVPMNRYPDPLANDVRDLIAQQYGLARENVMVGNGGDELLFNIAFAWGGPGRIMLDCPPTFSVYASNARLCGTTVLNINRELKSLEQGTALPSSSAQQAAESSSGYGAFPLNEEAVLERVAQGDIDYLTICSPNNPTGDLASVGFIERLLDASDTLVVVDEAYEEFAPAASSVVPLIEKHKNLAVLRTLSKAYSMAGVRLGYLLANPEVIIELQKVRQPYSVDSLSQTVAKEVFKFQELFEARTTMLISERDRVYEALSALDGVQAYPSAANFILFKPEGADAAEVWQKLYDAGVLVRDFSASIYTPNCLRVSIGIPEQNDSFLATLASILEED
ncbi:MAG: aminotransferase class I/II-fold pyridoxal phosphate-dependent enzyme [Eggerthellaceae bacterium]|nr:aminotransferase class I/II-fold pyridoxal phosphate-dependent enzyme [Eggerthellaceae bacterium]